MIDLQKFPGKPLVAIPLIWVGFLITRLTYYFSFYHASYFSFETFLTISTIVTVTQGALFLYIWLTFWRVIQVNYPQTPLDVFFLLVLLGGIVPNVLILAYQPIADISPSFAEFAMLGTNLFHLLTFMLFGIGVLITGSDLWGLKKPFGILLILVALAGSLFTILPIWSNAALYFGINGVESFISLLYSLVFTQIFLRAHRAEFGSPAPTDLLIEEIGEADDDL